MGIFSGYAVFKTYNSIAAVSFWLPFYFYLRFGVIVFRDRKFVFNVYVLRIIYIIVFHVLCIFLIELDFLHGI